MHEPDEHEVFTQQYWDEKYAATERVWSGQPNQRLVEYAAVLPPGTALDVGCGEGADAVWLAERGWRVTGVDLSPVAIERARAHAGQAGVADRTTWQQHDLLGDAELPGGADLVSAMYIHVPEDSFDRVYTRIADAVRPGGTLLVAGHNPGERKTDLRSPHLAHLLFSPERVTSVLKEGWVVEVADSRRRETHNHEGQHRVAIDTVVVARREA